MGSAALACGLEKPRGTGDLGVVIERASGSLQVIETTGRSSLCRIEGLGDLSHASVVFSPDQRFAYVFGRDGGLSKVDLLEGEIDARIVQAGNSIGGAISQDGRLVAVSNYDPGGVKVFDATTLEQLADLPATGSEGAGSKVVGLVDAPGDSLIMVYSCVKSRKFAGCTVCLSDSSAITIKRLLAPRGRLVKCCCSCLSLVWIMWLIVWVLARLDQRRGSW